MLSNLDVAGGYGSTPDTSSGSYNRDQVGSFLLLGSSMYRPLVEILFRRLPSDLRISSLKRIKYFVLTNTLPSVTAEASILCNAIAWADPQGAASDLLCPLIKAVADELPTQDSPSQHISNALESALIWHLGLIAATLYHMGPAVIPHASALQVLVGGLITDEKRP